VKVPGSYTAPLLTLAVAADGASFAVAGEGAACPKWIVATLCDTCVVVYTPAAS
jgi:hypothetical protein